MYETEDDLDRLQALLDASYERAGSHVRSIWDEQSRLNPRALSASSWGCRCWTSQPSRHAVSPNFMVWRGGVNGAHLTAPSGAMVWFSGGYDLGSKATGTRVADEP
jgi:hypothetical protein